MRLSLSKLKSQIFTRGGNQRHAQAQQQKQVIGARQIQLQHSLSRGRFLSGDKPILPTTKIQSLDNQVGTDSRVETPVFYWKSFSAQGIKSKSCLEQVVNSATNEYLQWLQDQMSKTQTQADKNGHKNPELGRVVRDIQPNLVVLFISKQFEIPHHEVIQYIRNTFPFVKYIVGCQGSGALGNSTLEKRIGWPQEMSQNPAASLTMATLSEVDIKLTALKCKDIPSLDASQYEWEKLLGVKIQPRPLDKVQTNFMLFSNPLFPVKDLLQGLDYAYPDATKLGAYSESYGMFCWQKGMREDEQLTHNGSILLSLTGNLTIQTYHSECLDHNARRMGTYLVEKVKGNTIQQVKHEETGEVITPFEYLKQFKKFTRQTLTPSAVSKYMSNVAIALQNDYQLQENLNFRQELVGRQFSLGEGNEEESIRIQDTAVRVGQRIIYTAVDPEYSTYYLNRRLLSNRLQELEALVSSQRQPEIMGMFVFSTEVRSNQNYEGSNFDSVTVFEHYKTSITGLLSAGQIVRDGDLTQVNGLSCVVGVVRQGVVRKPHTGLTLPELFYRRQQEMIRNQINREKEIKRQQQDQQYKWMQSKEYQQEQQAKNIYNFLFGPNIFNTMDQKNQEAGSSKPQDEETGSSKPQDEENGSAKPQDQDDGSTKSEDQDARSSIPQQFRNDKSEEEKRIESERRIEEIQKEQQKQQDKGLEVFNKFYEQGWPKDGKDNNSDGKDVKDSNKEKGSNGVDKDQQDQDDQNLEGSDGDKK